VNTPVRRTGMAHVFKGSHSYTCTPRIHPLIKWTIPAFCLHSQSWYSFTDPKGMEGWFGLGWLVTYRNKYPAPGIEPGAVKGALIVMLCHLLLLCL